MVMVTTYLMLIHFKYYYYGIIFLKYAFQRRICPNSENNYLKWFFVFCFVFFWFGLVFGQLFQANCLVAKRNFILLQVNSFALN